MERESDGVAAVAEAKPVERIEPHQWNHDGNQVLLVKCVNRGGKSKNDFQWPQSGEVTTPNWEPIPTCESGGLFGWPWGLGLGGGKDPDYTGDWIVFAANPECVISIDNEKAKAGPTATVVYYGSWHGAMNFTQRGRDAWILHASLEVWESAVRYQGASSATGYQGASSATGPRGASSATGDQGASSATGYQGASSATGDQGASSATGPRGASSATGPRGASSATGYQGASSATGYQGASSATGDLGASSATGPRGASSATGPRGASSATGPRGASSATGPRGASSATGYQGASSATGDLGASSATGPRGAAALTGLYGSIEVGPKAAGVVTCDQFTWIVHLGAVVLHRWADGHAVLTTDGLDEGERVTVNCGQITREVREAVAEAT